MSDGVTILSRTTRVSVVLSLVLAFTFGCGPKPVVTSEATSPTVVYPDIRPVEVHVISSDRSMTVRWKQQGTGTISGYNIYIMRHPVAGKSQSAKSAEVTLPHNTSVYPGDTNLDDEYIEYIADGLDNGVKYYISVKVVFPNQTMSTPSNELLAVCGPRGECSLFVRFKSENDGFSFVSGESVRADDATNDLYFFSKDGVDYLASPSRLNNYLRKSGFSLVSKGGTLDDVRKRLSADESLAANADRIAVSSGNWVLMKTVENHTVLIQVQGLSSESDSRRVTLWYAVCPMAGEAIF